MIFKKDNLAIQRNAKAIIQHANFKGGRQKIITNHIYVLGCCQNIISELIRGHFFNEEEQVKLDQIREDINCVRQDMRKKYES
ncbi:MAG: hypothetical protein ACOCUV_02585 [bacterium]